MNINAIIEKLPLLKRLIDWSKKVTFWGFDGVPLFEVLQFFFRGVIEGAVTTRGAALAFNFFLALFPAIIVLFSLLAYLPAEYYDEIIIQLEKMLPQNAYELSISTIEDLMTKRTGLLSFGTVMALFFASNAMSSLLTAFDQSTYTKTTDNYLMNRLKALILLIILSALLIVAISLIIFGKTTLDYLIVEGYIEDGISYALLSAGQWLVTLALFYFAISLMYYVGPSRKTRWNFFSAGSSLATLLVILVSWGFAEYVNHFGNYNKIYGSIGTLIVIMLWLYFNSIIILLGFELNASIRTTSSGRKKLLEELDGHDY